MLKCKVRNAFLILGPLMILAALKLTFPPIITLVLAAFGISQIVILLFRGWS